LRAQVTAVGPPANPGRTATHEAAPQRRRASATCVHISIIHRPLDARIFDRECRTLAAAGHEVHLVTAGPPARAIDGVRFHACAEATARPPLRRQWSRLLRASWHALSLRADIYHLQDPHLIPLGLALKLRGARVVYDVHEDYPAHARTKLLDKPARRALKPLVWRAFEAVARRTFDGFVCATPAIARRFPPGRTSLVRNVPRLEGFETAASVPWSERENVAIYAGLLTTARGTPEMVEMIELLPADLSARLVLLGDFRVRRVEADLRARPSWAKVDYLGFLSRPEMIDRLGTARVGLAVLHPFPNHLEAMPTKLFEYMAAGLPVVASDFPLWRELFAQVGCGLVVDPLDPAAIANAVAYLLTHPAEAEAMGRRGRAAIEARHNWRFEEPELLALYERLAPHRDGAAPRRASREER
jgi:glycosyltransferase involved in cell wall biosynthesis